MKVRESASRPARAVLISRPRRKNPSVKIIAVIVLVVIALGIAALSGLDGPRLALQDVQWLSVQLLVVASISVLLWLMWRSTDQRLVFDAHGIHFSTSLPAMLKGVQPDWSITWSELRSVRRGRTHPQAPNLPMSIVFTGRVRDREVSLMLPWQLEGVTPRPARHFYWKIENFVEAWIKESALLEVLKRFDIGVSTPDAASANKERMDQNDGASDQ